jgi:hypothetical protein
MGGNLIPVELSNGGTHVEVPSAEMHNQSEVAQIEVFSTQKRPLYSEIL